jgi:hypothetical protein
VILRADVPGVPSYPVGPEIWHVPLSLAIRDQAESVVFDAGPELLGSPGDADEELTTAYRDLLRARVVVEMTTALRQGGDRYTAPDGVRYALLDEPVIGESPGDGSLTCVSVPPSVPIVVEVLRFEDLPLGSSGSRRAVVRWSDGTQGEAARWFSDEVLLSEGDLVGKTRAQLQGVHGRRDRDWLQS